MRKVQLYIEGNRIELFNDEQIQVTSSIQNVQDISKTFTDFSQGFTVPASDVNNVFFEHWYNSDIDFTTDNNLRKDAYIEINLTTFRKGKVQLDGATLTNGKPSSYKLTFYGEGVTLKDTFGEDLLSDLDYSAYAHDFTSGDVLARIEDANNTYDVKYPLITSYRIWEYQSQSVEPPTPNTSTGTSTNNDIHTNSGAINKNELFPALRVARIFDEIQNKYGITFQGAFLQDERFTDLFLWYKGKEKLITSSVAQDINFTAKTPVFTNYDLSNYVDLTTNEINVQFLDLLVYQHIITFTTTSTTSSATYYVDIYQNGNLINSIASLGTGVGTGDLVNVLNVSGLDTTYSFKIRSEEANTIVLSVKYEVTYVSGGALLTDYINITCSNAVFGIPTINLSANAPMMKVADFFSGILKVFNMTTYSITDGEYWVEPLDDWYSKGAVVDVSEYVDVNTIEHTRMPLYKKISFKYQDSECVLNKYFATTFSKAYGDTTYQYNYDGGEFVVEVPFENLLQQKFNGTQVLQVGYSLNSEFAPYIPKPVLLYQYRNQESDFKWANDGGGHSTVVDYTPFGQDLLYNNTDYTLNFAPETSTLLNYPIQNTLFANYYFSYLYNLYNLKQRLVSVKAKLPVSLLTGLQLNDRLVIRDRRYIINEMKTNLTTGDADLQLILDFRPIVNSTNPNPKVSTEGGSVKYLINLPNNAVQASFSCSDSDVTFSPNPMTASGSLTIGLPSGAAGTVYTIVVTYTYLDGSTTTESFYIIQ
jgi:hypothetical protein